MTGRWQTIHTLLFVDDDNDDFQLFMRALKEVHVSLEVIKADDPREALSILNSRAEKPPVHIFLDYHMPIMNGMEFLQTLKQEARFSNIPVTMYSTDLSAPDIQLCKDIGVGYWKKPQNMFEIIQELRQRIDSIVGEN